MERHEGKSVRPLAIRHANAPRKNSYCKWKATAPNRGLQQGDDSKRQLPCGSESHKEEGIQRAEQRRGPEE